MRPLIHSLWIDMRTPGDYAAHSNIMWKATRTLNTLVGMDRSGGWMVHSPGQAIGAVTNATSGMTLAGDALPCYHCILDAGLSKFVR